MFMVLALTMLAVGIVTDAVFMYRQVRDMETRLTDAVVRAQDLASTGVTPEVLVQQVERGAVHARLTTGDDQQIGAEPPQSGVRLQRQPLAASGALKDSVVTVWESTDSILGARRSLDTSLGLVGILGIAGAMLLTVAVTDVALKPLEVMADRAKRITEGERGIRMHAPNDGTEVGRTASAIDDMLDELEGAEVRARQAERQACASAEQMQGFLSDAAHELKTPLAGIQAAAESIMQLPEDSTDEREQLAFLLGREASRGGQLVNSLLEAARVDAGPVLQPELLDLADLALAEQRRLSLAYPNVEVVVQGPNLLVNADRQGATSVLRNLVDNAGRAAAPTGWLVIDLSTRPGKGDQTMAVVRVIDSGTGIDPADQERVFDRLVRLASTASTTKGSGLGLPIARGYARAHGGDVIYVNNPDTSIPRDEDGQRRRPGACFEMTLPLARRAQAPQAALSMDTMHV